MVQATKAAVEQHTGPAAPIDPLYLSLPSEWELTDDLLLELCSLNDEWCFEADAAGALLIVPPAGSPSGRRGVRLSTQLQIWADQQGGGDVFDASAMFRLRDGNRRAPDVAWLSDERLAEIETEDEGVWPAAPDLVIEIRSRTDRLSALQAKMALWIANGVRLGWLVDPFAAQLHIYRPHAEPERLQRPAEIEDAELLPGLTVDLSRIWR